VRKPGDQSEQPPGGHAAERLREALRDRFGDDPELLPESLRPDDEGAPVDEEATPAGQPEAPEGAPGGDPESARGA